MEFEITKDKIYVKEVTNNVDAVIKARDFAQNHFADKIQEGKIIVFNDWFFQNENGEINYSIM